MVLSVITHAQDDIEQYLLTDSLQIESLIQEPHENEGNKGIKVRSFTEFGIILRSFAGMSDLNASLVSMGYGDIPELNPGWRFVNRIDIGERITLGFAYGGNYFIASYQKGAKSSSRYSYFDFLVTGAYRKPIKGFYFAPGIGLGFTQNMLTLKPNDLDEISWTELQTNSELVTAATQFEFALSVDITIGKYIRVRDNRLRSLDIRAGYLMHPFSFGKPGIPVSEINTVKITGMPSMSSSGPYLVLTWGFGARE
jgi:hypothetical protein